MRLAVGQMVGVVGSFLRRGDSFAAFPAFQVVLSKQPPLGNCLPLRHLHNGNSKHRANFRSGLN